MSVGNEKKAIQNGQYPVVSLNHTISPLSPRGRGTGSVINEEKDRKLHLALQRNNNFNSTIRNSQVCMYMLQMRQTNVCTFSPRKGWMRWGTFF